ncbi:unnamed protein product [Cylicostephanus goldi]|uniref:Uncharacterized protein n=1 Tax=Cylicostephanus goldi TaxID=71465 RepID=A0A3P6SH39_CYLGO|nr:unnamed protein product [Cylicostephanus goldi]
MYGEPEILSLITNVSKGEKLECDISCPIDFMYSHKSVTSPLLFMQCYSDIMDVQQIAHVFQVSLGGNAPKGTPVNYKVLKEQRKKQKSDEIKKAKEMRSLLQVTKKKHKK